ncbi:hypothetical protein BO78DRAFT_23747 [Aspergillus sclerotiicarbonarius CBS 121057]|uniref:Uncharacterized protein n=1 Tax=Aspergillus sclerotiicarbonarius (strain CBS 121057 / IBT 28362) TaxID=1448318 RepID=A0A319EHN2_ASPSB|nr:hypothetical protein BO78DRAFT_23747 [Aspergillus sclerotiicarbonarius CBS 121057]
MSTQTPSQKVVLQATRFQDIDKDALKKLVEANVGEPVTFDEEKATVKDFGGVYWPVASALLVQENGRGGRIQIHEQSGECVLTTMTGSQFDTKFSVAWLKKGQNFRFYGNPSVWLFKPLSPDA